MKTKKILVLSIFVLVVFIFVGGGCSNGKQGIAEDTENEQTTQKKEIIENIEEKESTKDIKIGSVENDLENLEKIQESVNNGSQPWRLDPYTVAITDGVELGFNQEKDAFTLVSKTEMGEYSGTGEAEVEAVHDETTYIIQLIQPIEQGDKGIWAINNVREK